MFLLMCLICLCEGVLTAQCGSSDNMINLKTDSLQFFLYAMSELGVKNNRLSWIVNTIVLQFFLYAMSELSVKNNRLSWIPDA